jgi:hypothetical protein
MALRNFCFSKLSPIFGKFPTTVACIKIYPPNKINVFSSFRLKIKLSLEMPS